MKVLSERRLDDADEDRVSEQVVYFDNGCVVRQVKDAKGKVTEKEMIVRIFYADNEMVGTLLEAIKNHMGC